MNRLNPTDAERLDAIAGFEDMVVLARHALIAAETLCEEVWQCAYGESAKLVLERFPGMRGMRILVLSEDQFEGAQYALSHARDRADELRTAYYKTIYGEDRL